MLVELRCGWQFFRELRDLSVQLVWKETKFGCGSAEIDDVQDLARRATVRDVLAQHLSATIRVRHVQRLLHHLSGDRPIEGSETATIIESNTMRD
jgi:hypothetical protein